jgi:anti-anti-sigma factor
VGRAALIPAPARLDRYNVGGGVFPGGCEAVAAVCKGYHLVVRPVPDGVAVHPLGLLDPEGAWLLDESLGAAADAVGAGCLYLDCVGVEYIGGMGLSFLIRLNKRVRDRGGRVVLCAASAPVQEVLQITKLDRIFTARGEGIPGGGPGLPDPAWLAWNGGTVGRLTRAIRDERAFDRLPLLADALEEAGCTDPDLLGHCRWPGSHGGDCWVVGLLSGGK